MSHCTEFAVFTVKKEKQARVIELSERLFGEMNSEKKVLISHDILRKTDNDEEICWHLIWRDEDAVKENAQKWSSFPSSPELESLVGERLYYGHFVKV
jgi:quinol monooxygenase YgiN